MLYLVLIQFELIPLGLKEEEEEDDDDLISQNPVEYGMLTAHKIKKENKKENWKWVGKGDEEEEEEWGRSLVGGVIKCLYCYIDLGQGKLLLPIFFLLIFIYEKGSQ